MASNFTAVWRMVFSWLGQLLKMPLPIFYGNVSLNLLDIIIGTAGILVAFGSIRALLKSSFTLAGKEIRTEFNHQQKVRQLNDQAHTEYINRQNGVAYIENLKREGRL